MRSILAEEREEGLLIRKKRGIGAGKINGPGGKIDPGETPLECAIRETREELCVTALHPEKHGELWFEFTDGLRMLVHVFLAKTHTGEAKETAEAIPLWTRLDRLPVDEMWEDDRYWLKELMKYHMQFNGRCVRRRAHAGREYGLGEPGMDGQNSLSDPVRLKIL